MTGRAHVVVPSRPHLLYETVAGHVTEAIASGALRPGDRLPSIRRMSEQHRVSISTVLQAYMQLEAAGVVEARPQSGHYVRARRAIPEPRAARPPEATSTVSLCSVVASVYADCLHASFGFGAAYMPRALLPARRLARLMAAELRAAEHGGTEYDPPPGHVGLRQQLARRSLEWGCALSPDELLVSFGAAEALNLSLMAVARRGDVIAVESPTYFGILQALEAHGLRALEIPSDPQRGLRLDALEKGLARHRVAAVLAVTNFSNPLGSCMSDEDKEKLVGILARREIPLIEDDVFGDLHHGPDRPRVAKSFDRRGLVLLCGSVSKTLGHRVGWVTPGRFLERVQLLKFSQTVATATLPQRAVARFLESGGYDRYLRGLRRTLATSVRRMIEAVHGAFPPGTRLSQPRGGMVLWIELPRGVSALELHRRALAEGISIAPGPIFSARQRLDRYVRLNAAQVWDARVESAVARLGRLAGELREDRRRKRIAAQAGAATG